MIVFKSSLRKAMFGIIRSVSELRKTVFKNRIFNTYKIMKILVFEAKYLIGL